MILFVIMITLVNPAFSALPLPMAIVASQQTSSEIITSEALFSLTTCMVFIVCYVIGLITMGSLLQFTRLSEVKILNKVAKVVHLIAIGTFTLFIFIFFNWVITLISFIFLIIGGLSTLCLFKLSDKQRKKYLV